MKRSKKRFNAATSNWKNKSQGLKRMTEKSFYVIGREESEEYLESEKPALDQLIAMGYEYKTQQELNIERKDYRQILLYDRLEKAIRKLNPEIDDDGFMMH